jgi:osmotically-inducible protein OsmY
MLMRTVRWIVALTIASAMTAVGCAGAPRHERVRQQRLVVPADTSVVHAFDTQMELRLLDHLALDNFLRDRDIHVRVLDGSVSLTGEVWTPLEKERVGELVRAVPGVVDVSNELDIHPPR